MLIHAVFVTAVLTTKAVSTRFRPYTCCFTDAPNLYRNRATAMAANAKHNADRHHYKYFPIIIVCIVYPTCFFFKLKLTFHLKRATIVVIPKPSNAKNVQHTKPLKKQNGDNHLWSKCV